MRRGRGRWRVGRLADHIARRCRFVACIIMLALPRCTATAICSIRSCFHRLGDVRHVSGSTALDMAVMNFSALLWKPPYVYSTTAQNCMPQSLAMSPYRPAFSASRSSPTASTPRVAATLRHDFADG